MMILTEGMNLEDVPAVVDRMGAEAETVDRAAEAPEMAVRMVVGQADGDRIHGDQAVVAQADLVQWDLSLYTSPSPRDRQKSRMPSSA